MRINFQVLALERLAHAIAYLGTRAETTDAEMDRAIEHFVRAWENAARADPQLAAIGQADEVARSMVDEAKDRQR